MCSVYSHMSKVWILNWHRKKGRAVKNRDEMKNNKEIKRILVMFCIDVYCIYT